MKVFFRSLATILAILFIFSCSKTTFVGSDIFPNGIDVFYKDDFEIIAKTIRRDSIITYDQVDFMNSMICGRIEDPIFGTTEAEMFIDLHITSLIPQFQYLEDAVSKEVELDSVVLVLGYDPLTFYGDSTVTHDIEVNLLSRKLLFEDSIFSTFQGTVDDEILASKTLIPNLRDTLHILEPLDTSTTAYTEMLRMPVDDAFAQAMIEDTSLVSSDDNFTTYARGIRVKSTPAGNSLWGVDWTKTAESPYNSIIVYYSRDTIKNSYRIFVDGDRSNYFNHDYSGSVVEEFIDDVEKGDSLLFLQGMAGTDIELDIPAFADPAFDEFLVNKAELEFFVLEDESSDLYEPISSILLQRFDEEGNIIVTEDVFLALQVLNDASFDGVLTETVVDGMTLKKYTAVMSVHALRMFNDENPDTKLRISARNKRIRPNRTIVFGPGHSKYPMKFKLTYSK